MKRNKKKENLLPYLETQRAEKLAEMGSYLRHLRQEQSLSLEEVAAKTKVQARLLHAIEEGNLEPLPEPIFIKGFLKRYADTLGLDGEEFASIFPTGQSFQFLRPSWQKLPIAQLRPIHLYMVYIFLIICAVSGLSNMVNKPGPQVEVSNPQTEKSAVVPPPPPKPQSPKGESLALVSSASAAGINQQGEPVRVNITLKASSWIRVITDGKTAFEGVLSEGEQRTWVAKEELVVRAGNAGGVLIAFNEGEAKQLGDPGSTKTVTFKAN